MFRLQSLSLLYPAFAALMVASLLMHAKRTLGMTSSASQNQRGSYFSATVRLPTTSEQKFLEAETQRLHDEFALLLKDH
jgi:hypothetical protein